MSNDYRNMVFLCASSLAIIYLYVTYKVRNLHIVNCTMLQYKVTRLYKLKVTLYNSRCVQVQ